MSFAIVNSLNTFWIHAFIYLTHFCKYHIHSFLNLALFMDEGYLIYSKLISVLKKITTITYMSVTQVGSNVLQVSQKKKNNWIPDLVSTHHFVIEEERKPLKIIFLMQC